VDSARRFWRLPRPEKACFLQAAFWLPVTVLGLRWLGLRRWQTFLAWPVPSRSVAPADPAARRALAESTARMVAAAARRVPFQPGCLPRALVLWRLLRRRGLDAQLRFGGRFNEAQLEAHAWVEVEGGALDIGDDSGLPFAPFLPSHPSREGNRR
jgi:hypothetical protein